MSENMSRKKVTFSITNEEYKKLKHIARYNRCTQVSILRHGVNIRMGQVVSNIILRFHKLGISDAEAIELIKNGGGEL